MDNMVIKVKTEDLIREASELNGDIAKMRTEIIQIKNRVTRTAMYWKGEAADAHRRAYSEREDEIEEIIKRLTEHVIDLQKMAGIYQETENSVEEISNSLPGNVIV